MKTAYEAEVGEEVALYCPVNGYPPPEVEWTFYGKKVKTSLSKVLVIPNVMENDYGSYLCTAKSLEGTVGPFTITLSKTNSKLFCCCCCFLIKHRNDGKIH